MPRSTAYQNVRHEIIVLPGKYKHLPYEVGGRETTLPKHVSKEMKALLKEYNAKKQKPFDDILDLHYRFECIHPFQDGNRRVGRLIMFKECMANCHITKPIESIHVFCSKYIKQLFNVF